MKLFRPETSRGMYLFLASLCFALLLLLWFLLSHSAFVEPYFLPSPLATVRGAVELVYGNDYWHDVLISTYRVMTAFAVSTVLAVPLGIVVGVNKHAEAFIEPFVGFFRYLPISGFIPLSILWLGLGEEQKIGVLILGIFFQMVPMTFDVVRGIKREYLDAARVLGASDKELLLKVVLPHSSPGIYDAARISIGIGWTYVVLAEVVAAGSGIGHVIIQAQRYLKTDYIFVGIFTVGLLGLVTDALFRLLRGPLFPWERYERAGR